MVRACWLAITPQPVNWQHWTLCMYTMSLACNTCGRGCTSSLIICLSSVQSKKDQSDLREIDLAGKKVGETPVPKKEREKGCCLAWLIRVHGPPRLVERLCPGRDRSDGAGGNLEIWNVMQCYCDRGGDRRRICVSSCPNGRR